MKSVTRPTKKTGRYQAADGGTLFRDAVDEISLEIQNQLLRILQDGEYERAGEETTPKMNVRLIADANWKLA